MARPNRALDPVFSTAPPPTRLSGIALAGLRILAGLMWLYNVVWKTPPDFGENGRGGLCRFTHFAVDHPVFPPYSWLVEHVVLPNFTAFGWLVLVVETLLAVLLLTGTAVRLAALIGVGQSLAITLSVAEAPGEWPWAYAMMVGIHLVLLLTPCAQYAAVDAIRAAAVAGNRAPVARRLLGGWGVIIALIGIIAVAQSVADDDWLAPHGRLVGYQKLEFSLGNYNLLAALVLLGVSVLMIAAALMQNRLLALSAAVIAAAAAVSIYIQLGRTAIWLGGTATTAAVFVCAAVVAVGARQLRTVSSETRGA
ncbi:MAG: Rv1678 family membrane protein [Mycobacterium sp.]